MPRPYLHRDHAAVSILYRISRSMLTVGLVAAALWWGAGCRQDQTPTGADLAHSIAELRLEARSTTIFVGDRVRIVPVLLDRNGTAIDPSSLPQGIRWTSSDQGVADVYADGTVQGVGRGISTIVARVEALSAAVAVVVRGVPTTITVSRGQALTTTIGHALPDSTRVYIRDKSGTGVPGIKVQFAVLTGGGSVVPTETVTDGSGAASTDWTLGMAVGPQQLEARAVLGSGPIAAPAAGSGAQPADRADVTTIITAEASATPPAHLTLEPASQTLIAGESASVTPTVTDAFDQVLSDIAVTMGSSNRAVADPDASGAFVAGSVGTTTLTADVVSDPSITATARVTVEAGPPSSLTKIGGDRQSGRPFTALPEPLVVEVEDVAGNPLSGVTVSWVVDSGAATVPGSGASTTDENGRASTSVTLGAEGKVAVSAHAGGLSAAFEATAASTPLRITTSSLPAGTDGAAYGQSLSATGGKTPYTWSLSGAPGWLSIDSGTGQLSGTAATGSYTFGATVSSSDGQTADRTFGLTVNRGGGGAPLLFEDDFESGNLSASSNGVAWKFGRPGVNVAVSTDNAYGSGKSLEFTYPAKADQCADATAEQRFSLPNLHEVWLEYMFYLPATFYHRQITGCPSNASNQKLLRIWGPTEGAYSAADPHAGADFLPIGNGNSRVFAVWWDYNDHMGGGQIADSNWNPAFTDANRGKWMQLRWHFKLASSEGAADGEIQLWVNGALTISWTGLSWHTEAGVGNWFSNGYLMGWANSSYARTTKFFIDNFRVYGANPGW